jgi:hypothetical protein
LGKEEDEVEEHGGEGDREYERRQVRETVCVIRKEAEIHGGRSGIAGATDEARKQQGSPDEAGEGARIEEAPAASLDDPERDQRHAGDEQDEAGQIGQLTRRFVARLRGAVCCRGPRRRCRPGR